MWTGEAAIRTALHQVRSIRLVVARRNECSDLPAIIFYYSYFLGYRPHLCRIAVSYPHFCSELTANLFRALCRFKTSRGWEFCRNMTIFCMPTLSLSPHLLSSCWSSCRVPRRVRCWVNTAERCTRWPRQTASSTRWAGTVSSPPASSLGVITGCHHWVPTVLTVLTVKCQGHQVLKWFCTHASMHSNRLWVKSPVLVIICPYIISILLYAYAVHACVRITVCVFVCL